MARRRGRLAILVLLCLFAAGCTAAPKAEWGDVKVELSSGVAEIESNLGPNSVDFEEGITDCDGGVVSLEGRLATSIFYTSHKSSTNLTYATVAAVAIQEMSFNQASEVAEGAGIRVQVKDWNPPLNPDTTGGNGDLTSSDTLEGEWFVIGIIPGSKNVAEGLGIIEQWHQPIKMKGWIVGPMKGGKVSTSCTLDASAPGSGANFLATTLIVTEIETEAGVVSLDGDDDDEWVVGDISIVGRWGYLVILILVGFGGGAGLFIYSTIMIRKSADDAALTLMGEESFSAAKEVSEQAKRDAESSDMPSRSQQKEKAKPKVEETPEVVEIAGFSLDNVLSSSGSSRPGPTKEAGGGGVVATEESVSMDKTVKSSDPPTTTSSSASPAAMSMPSISSSPPASSDSGGVTSTSEPTRDHFSSVMSSSPSQSSSSNQPAAQRKVRKKRSVKKAVAPEEQQPEPESKPEPRGPPKRRTPPRESSPPQTRTSVADEDFEDFSL